MIIRTLDEVIGTERDVAGEGWRSRRLLLKRDAMGFSLHDTVVEAGWEKEMEYANHLEACYCIKARGRSRTSPPASVPASARHGLRARRPRPPSACE